MRAFLFIDLVTAPAYHQPVPEYIKQALPDMAVLDLDAKSGDLVQHYALRLLLEVEQVVVCIKANNGVTDISVLMPFFEELFQGKEQRLVLLLGQHARLQRMFDARPEVSFKVVEEEGVLDAVNNFFSQREG